MSATLCPLSGISVQFPQVPSVLYRYSCQEMDRCGAYGSQDSTTSPGPAPTTEALRFAGVGSPLSASTTAIVAESGEPTV